MSALKGKRIAVTRPLPDAKTLADLLTAQGAEAVITPLIAIRPLDNTRQLDAHLQKRYDWIIFTSANAVRAVWERLAAQNISLQMGQAAAIGVKTGAELARHGITPSIMPDKHTAEALFDAMHGHLMHKRIFLPQADRARPVLADMLRDAGAHVEAITAYHTVSITADDQLLAGGFDAITFMSASTVESLIAQADDIGGALIACIGPVTAEAARRAGLPVHVTAAPHTAEGLVSGLLEAFERMFTQ